MVPATLPWGGDLQRGRARHPLPAWSPTAAQYRQQTHHHGQAGGERYEKQVPGHHVQIDVKFLSFPGQIKRYQFTAVDNATRVRALKIYCRHTQDNGIKFVDFVRTRFPFRICTIRTDNGHEFQARFHWHLKDLAIEHVYIKPRSPRLNGNVEGSHRTDQAEFYQLIEYKGDVDLEKRLAEWQKYYNLHRPHTAHGGRTPFEVLHEKLTGKAGRRRGRER